MSSERQQQMKVLLAAALERKTDERKSYLDHACADESVRSEVDSLLAAQQPTETGGVQESAASPEPLQPGVQLGRYRIGSRLGAGGMGVVYSATDTKLGRHVALKVLPAAMARDPEHRERFQREARWLAALNHPHIVTLHSIEESDGIHFLTMELVQGQSLDRLILEGGISLARIREIVVSIAEALAAAHDRGIIHRDLKPSNVMLTEGGRIKVLDFGLAKGIQADTADGKTLTRGLFTNPAIVLGTPAYMSPEQARGERLTTASDLFSLGIIAYQMITGRHPFESDSTVGLLYSIAYRPVLPPSRLVPDTPVLFESIVMRMLEKEPDERPSAKELLSVLSGPLHRPVNASLPEVKLSLRRVIGRKKELSELQAAFRGAAAEQGYLICVTGEPGQGKTAVVEEFLIGLAATREALIGRGRCSERLAGAEAYLPILETLDSLLNGAEREFVARAMKSLAPTWYALIAPAAATQQTGTPSQEKLKRELGALLAELSRQRPTVIFLDDVHWADISTVDLLSYLGTKLDRTRLLIIASYRGPELRTNNAAFLKLQWELQSRSRCRELALDFFSTGEIRELIQLEYGANRFPAEFAQAIHRRTEGNPLFVVDLLRYLRERRGIVLQDDVWILSGSLAETLSGLPETIRSMLQRKIEQLAERERRLLMAASVQGADFEAAVIAKALDADPAQIDEALAALERSSDFVAFVEEHEYPNRTLTSRYSFVHALYQNAFYAALLPAQRILLSKTVAETLLDFHGSQAGKIAAQLAFLFEAARDFDRAADQYQTAAQNALMLFANHEAETLARRGLQVVGSLPESETRSRKELALQKALAAALRNLQSHSGLEVGATLRRVNELARELNDEPTLFSVHYGLAWSHHTHQEFPKALEQAKQCLRIAERSQNSALIAAALLVLGDIATHQGRLRESREHLQGAWSHYDASNAALYVRMIGSDPGVHAQGALGQVLGQMGFPDQGKACLRESIDLGRRTQNPIARAVSLLCAILSFKHFREEEILRKSSEELAVVCLENELHSSMLYFAKFGAGWALALGGKAADGLSKIEEAIAGALAVGLTYGIPMLAYGKAEVMHLAGHAEGACKFLTEQITAAEQCGQLFYIPDLYRLKGEILRKIGADANDDSGPEQYFLRAIESAQATGSKLCELEAATSLAELYQAESRKAEAASLLGSLYGWFTEGFDAPPLKRAETLLKELSQ